MMWTNLKETFIILLALTCNSIVDAQGSGDGSEEENPALPEALQLWEFQLFPEAGVEASIMYGNGVSLTPDERHVIATSVGGTVTALNAGNGVVAWEYNPTPAVSGGTVRTHS